MPYVFYDTETTGTNTAFDQILQFAAIRTDDEMNELDCFHVRCRLLPYVVPSPGALLATGVTPAMLTDPYLPSHYEAMRQIQAKLRDWTPAVFIGWNSILFDEHFLRQAFFQTLQPLYLTTTGGNARSDAMRVAQAVQIYAPGCLEVPVGEEGRPSFRLDAMAPANGHPHEQAHEALADVRATLFLARRTRSRAPEVWEGMQGMTRKHDVKNFLSNHLMVSSSGFHRFGTYSRLVAFCGANPEDDAQLAVFDLSFDPEHFVDLSEIELFRVMKQQKTPIRKIRSSTLPILMPAEAAPEKARGGGYSENEWRRRAEVIRKRAGFRARVAQALKSGLRMKVPSPHVEERIYDLVPRLEDHEMMAEFHRVDWSERPALVGRIRDPRIRECARRLIHAERPEVLSGAERGQLDRWAAERVSTEDPEAPWMTVPEAIREVERLRADPRGSQMRILAEIEKFLRGYSL